MLLIIGIADGATADRAYTRPDRRTLKGPPRLMPNNASNESAQSSTGNGPPLCLWAGRTTRTQERHNNHRH